MADANIIIRVVDQTRGGLSSLIGEVDRVKNNASNAERGMIALGAAVSAVAAAFSVKAFVDFADSVQNINNRLNLVSPSAEAAAQAYDKLLKVANDTRTPLEETVTLYSRLSQSNETLKLNQEQLVQATENFNKALVISGATTSEAQSAILQFSQAMGSGVLRGEEFNAVNEAAPRVMQALASELGVTRGELRKMAEDGLLNSKVVMDALLKSTEALDAEFEKIKPTIGGALTVLKNNFLDLGQSALPVFEAIARGILLLAENLDVAVVAVGSLIAAFAATKFVAAVNAVGGLTGAVTLLNTAIRANPVGLVMTAMAAAVTAVYVYWDDLKRIAENAFKSIYIAGLNVEKWFLEFAQNTINGVLQSISNFGIKTTGFLKAIAAAALDPLNAFEAFSEVMEETNTKVQNNSVSVVDFSGKIKDLDSKITAATSTTKTHTGAVDNNTIAVEDNTEATEDDTKATNDLSPNKAILTREVVKLEAAYRDAVRKVDESIQAYENETAAMKLSEDQRDIIAKIIQDENTFRNALGDDIAALSEEEIRLIYEVADADKIAHLDFLKISDEQIKKIIGVVGERQKMVDEVARLNAVQRANDQARLDAQREAQRIASDFTRDTERANQRYYEETTSKSKQLQDELNEYIKRARELGRINNQEVQDAIKSYNYQINRAMEEDFEDMMKKQEDAVKGFRDEYSVIYDDIYGLLEKWTGKSMREIEKYNTYAKFLFGVDILGAFNGGLDSMLMGISGWRGAASDQMYGWANQTAQYAALTGDYVGNGVFGSNGVASKGMMGFVNASQYALGQGGLFGWVQSLFGSLGGWMQNLFGGVFNWIGSGLNSIGGFLGNIFGSGGNLLTNVLGGIAGALGVKAIGNLFGGKSSSSSPNNYEVLQKQSEQLREQEERYRLSREVANVREELQQLGVTGYGSLGLDTGNKNLNQLTDELMQLINMEVRAQELRQLNEEIASQGVNVNFTINAVNASDIDRLLIEREQLLVDIIRDAVSSSGRGIR